MDKREEKTPHGFHEEGIRFSAAHTYSMDNLHLNKSEKLEVELWYQFPFILGHTILCFLLIYKTFEPISFKNIITFILITNLFVGLVNWYYYLPKFNKIFFYSIGHNYIQWILSLTTIGLLIYASDYYWILVVVFGKIGILSMFYPSIFVYSILARKYRVHPKYAFFKKNYGKKFIFDEDQ